MKKILLNESEKRKLILEREKAIVESFAKTFNSIKRIDENEITGEDKTVYIDRQLSDYFDIPYQNDGETTVINANTLRYKNTRSWDSKHLAIFDRYNGKDLLLKGKGFGWWEINTPNIVKNGIEEYDNYNYPAGADADPNAPWNQDDGREPEYEYRKGEFDEVDLDYNYNGPFENEMLVFRSTDGGVCEVTMGEVLKTLNIPYEIIEKLKANSSTSQENKIAQQMFRETGKYPEGFSQKVHIYNEITEPIFAKYGNEFAEYEYEVEQDEYERDDYDRDDDYDDRDYDREFGGVDW